MLINAETKVYGIIGYPIKHSLSPKLHCGLFDFYSLNSTYVAFETNNIKAAIEGIRALSIKGVNVTIPYKEDVISLIDEVEENASRLGAVNTIKNENGRLTGYNTDYLGFTYMFKKAVKNNYASKKITVIGAGGAAKSIIYALYKTGVNSIYLLNRTEKNAEKTKEKFKGLLDINISGLNDKQILSNSDVIINCTSVGLTNRKSPININYVDKATIMDIIYKDSLLIKQAESKNLKAINGMDMFVGQALHAFEIFTGIKPDEKIVRNLLKET